MGGAYAPSRSPPGIGAPDIRHVYIQKPGKREKRPLGVPCVNDRALQRSVAQVLSAIYEADLYEGFGVKRDVVLARAAMTAA